MKDVISSYTPKDILRGHTTVEFHKYPDPYKAPVVFEKYPDPIKVPKVPVESKALVSKLIDRSLMYLGRDGKYYPTWEATADADEFWRQSRGLVPIPKKWN